MGNARRPWLAGPLGIVSALLIVPERARAADSGLVRGTVVGPDGKPLAAVHVLLINHISGFG